MVRKTSDQQYDAPVWEDLRFPATGIAIGGFASAPDIQTDTGLLLFDADAVETVGILAQLPHSWDEGSAIRPHVHWAKTTDAAGDVVWSYRYKWFGFDEVQPAWSGVIEATDINTVDDTQKQIISNFGEITPPAGTAQNVSSLIMMQLGRLATDGDDDYGADCVLYEFDLHYQRDALGTTAEFST